MAACVVERFWSFGWAMGWLKAFVPLRGFGRRGSGSVKRGNGLMIPDCLGLYWSEFRSVSLLVGVFLDSEF